MPHQNKTTGRFPRKLKHIIMKPRELLKQTKCVIVKTYKHGQNPDYEFDTINGTRCFMRPCKDRESGIYYMQILCDNKPERLPDGVQWVDGMFYMGELSDLSDQEKIAEILKTI